MDGEHWTVVSDHCSVGDLCPQLNMNRNFSFRSSCCVILEEEKSGLFRGGKVPHVGACRFGKATFAIEQEVRSTNMSQWPLFRDYS